MPRALLFLLTIISLFGQFSGLSTNNDGTQLYFSTSLQLNGTNNENANGKIFRYDSTGLHFVAQVGKVTLPSPLLTNAYNLVSGYISGSGAITGYSGSADCGRGCWGVPGNGQTTLFYPDYTVAIPYACTVSGNAQYAACANLTTITSAQYSIYNLFASSRTPAYVLPCGSIPGSLSSDGHFLCGNTLWSASGSTTVNLQGNIFPNTELLSDDGSHILTFSGTSLFSYDVATGTTTSVPLPDGMQIANLVSLSSSGSIILFGVFSNSMFQFQVIHADGTGFLQLTNDPIGVSSGLLSGDGSTAFLSTSSGNLLKIDTTSGASTAIANGIEFGQQLQGVVAGAPVTVRGLGFADATLSASTVPLGTSLAGTQVTVNGTPAPLFSVSPVSITFQIPWETPIGNASIEVLRPGSSFQPPVMQVQIQNLEPENALSYAISQDFSKANSAANPANPGDIVNFYLTGLGPATAPAADGTPSPSNPLPRLINPVTVTDQSGSTQLAVLYAGLAPGLIGIYQITVQLPPVIATYSLFYPVLNSTLTLPPVYVVPNQ